ncbi:hypothetical protein ACHQM5_025440 [Ranunculus cassubicifolius]
MPQSWLRALLVSRHGCSGRRHHLPNRVNSVRRFWKTRDILDSTRLGGDIGFGTVISNGLSLNTTFFLNEGSTVVGGNCRSITHHNPTRFGFCGLAVTDSPSSQSNIVIADDVVLNTHMRTDSKATSDEASAIKGPKKKRWQKKAVVEFSKIDSDMLPTVILVGRPNVGKSALFNRLIRRREALVYNTLDDHVTRDVREGIAKLGDLRFRVLDSAGLEMAPTSGSILGRTAEMTGNVIARSQFAVFLIDVREGLHPMDLEVGKWLRKHASGIRTVLVMNKCESLDDHRGNLTSASAESYKLGYGDPIAISAETGMGMVDLYEALLPLLEEQMLQTINEKACEGKKATEVEDSKLPLQLAIVGRPNIGKSTLLNAILQQERVLVGPEAGLTRDSVRADFKYQGRTIYLVDTAGWLDRTKQVKGPASLSIMQSRKSLLRAHVIALVLDGEEIANAKSSMKHSEVVIARRAVEEGRSLVVIVNKMDLLQGDPKLHEKVLKAVPEEIQTVIPQICSPSSHLHHKPRDFVCVSRSIRRMCLDEEGCVRVEISFGKFLRWFSFVMDARGEKSLARFPAELQRNMWIKRG